MRKLFVCSLLLFCVGISPAYAYIDPGAGSMLLQSLIGGIAASIAFISVYYAKIKETLVNFFKSKKKQSEHEEPKDEM